MRFVMLMRPGRATARWWPALLCALLLAGCRKEEVRVYRVPKETPAPDPMAAAHAHGAGAPRITWKAPAGWNEQDSGGVRIVRFVVQGKEGQTAEVGVVPLTGAGINRTDLLNMVRTQAELGPLAEGDLDKLTEKVAIGPLQGDLVDMASTNALIEGKFKVRILMASVKDENTLWLFKIAGADGLVAEQRPAFLDFLKSVQFLGDTGGVVAAHGAMGTTPPIAQASASPSAKPQWEVPPAWQEQPPGPMVLARFVIRGTEGSAEVSVSAFPGDTGGLVANVNRWRGQLGLEPLGAPAVEKAAESLDVTGGKANLVDMTGTDRKTGQPARLIGAIVPRGGQTWFFKLLGNAQVAGREKAAFQKFIQSAKFPDA